MKDFGKLGNFPCNNEISYELRCFRNKEAIYEKHIEVKNIGKTYEKEQKADCGGVHDGSHGVDISPNMLLGGAFATTAKADGETQIKYDIQKAMLMKRISF